MITRASTRWKFRLAAVVTLLLLIGTTGAAQAAVYQVALGGNANIGNATATGNSLGTLAPTSGDGSVGSPWLYTFTTGGLDMGSLYIYYHGNSYGGAATLDMASYDLVGTGALAFDSHTGSVSWGKAGANILVRNVGIVDIGGIDMSQTVGRNNAGSVQIGELATPATSNVRISYINASRGGGSSNYASITPNISIYGAADVSIKDAGGTAGDLQSWASYATRSGAVIAVHDGAFVANNIDNHVYWSGTSGAGWVPNGIMNFNGDADGNGPDGAFQANDLIGWIEAQSGNQWLGDATNLTVSGYLSVSINSIDLHHYSISRTSNNAGHDPHGGDVLIQDISGNVTIAGPINLNAQNDYGSTVKDGKLQIAAGGQVTLGTLDLDQVLFAELQAVADSEITGSLFNFNTTAGSGSGSTFDPFVTSQTKLRTGIGKIIYYDAANPDNAYLGGYTYQVADLVGNAGQGGWLTPGAAAVPEPATLGLLALGGLMGLTRLLRRRRG